MSIPPKQGRSMGKQPQVYLSSQAGTTTKPPDFQSSACEDSPGRCDLWPIRDSTIRYNGDKQERTNCEMGLWATTFSPVFVRPNGLLQRANLYNQAAMRNLNIRQYRKKAIS